MCNNKLITLILSACIQHVLIKSHSIPHKYVYVQLEKLKAFKRNFSESGSILPRLFLIFLNSRDSPAPLSQTARAIGVCLLTQLKSKRTRKKSNAMPQGPTQTPLAPQKKPLRSQGTVFSSLSRSPMYTVAYLDIFGYGVI